MIKRAIAITLLLASVAGAGQYYALHHARRGRVTDTWAAAGLNTGLVEYWAMRTSGTTVLAEYGTNTGTAVNSPTFSATNGVRDDGVRLLSASTQYINAGSVYHPQITNQITVAAWINTTTSGAVAMKWNIFTTAGWGLDVTGGGVNKIQFGFYNSGGTKRFRRRGNTVVTDGAWRHVVATHGGAIAANQIKLYVNGVEETYSLDETTNPDETMANSQLWLGNRQGGAFLYNGSIDEVAIWNRALSSNEVYQIYNTPLYAPYKQ